MKFSTNTLVDADVHNVLSSNEELFDYLPDYWIHMIRDVGSFPAGGPDWRNPMGLFRCDAKPPGGGLPASDPNYLVTHHLDANQIEYAILTGSCYGVGTACDIDFANAVASAYNRNLQRRWLDASDRFRGSILVNHADPAAAAREINEMAADRRFVQVLMGSGSSRGFGHRCYDPIYEAAVRHDLPVAFHPGDEGTGTAGTSTPCGQPARYFDWHNTLPLNYMAHVNSLVCEGTFEKFPTLRVAALEGGIGWLPHLMWRMDKNFKALRATTPWLKRFPSEYIVDHIRLTTQPVEEPAKPEHLLQIFEMVQAEKTVMFSSDYPHWDNDDPRFAFPRMPEAMQQRIFSDNARELYRLPPAWTEPAESIQPSQRASTRIL